jgi:hypothetical protein
MEGLGWIELYRHFNKGHGKSNPVFCSLRINHSWRSPEFDTPEATLRTVPEVPGLVFVRADEVDDFVPAKVLDVVANGLESLASQVDASWDRAVDV